MVVEIVKRTIMSLMALAAFAGSAFSCSVPVFRYALELWPQDSYRVAVLYKNRLDSAQTARVRWVASRALSVTGDTAGLETRGPGNDKTNVELVLVSVKDTVDTQTQKLLGESKNPSLPWCTVLFPQRAMNPSALYSGPLSEAPLDALFNSPAKHSLATALMKGESAVWVLVGSGDKGKDAAAFKTIAAGIEHCKKAIKLPDLDASDVKKVVKLSDIELKIDFSLIGISRSDPRERYFIDELEKTEPQLSKMRQEPIAFPVFARGRVLYALVGKGINIKNILDAAAFLTGPCACTIKDQNPGTDILMTFDWVAALSGKSIIEQAAIPLVGIDAFLPRSKTKTAGSDPGTPVIRSLIVSGRRVDTLVSDTAIPAIIGSALPRDSNLQNGNRSHGLIVKSAPEESKPGPSDASFARAMVPAAVGGAFGIGALVLITASFFFARKNRKNA